ncbi:putative small secreted protein [Rhizobium sp. BK313]|jgi:predicted small secreted protein|uniref:entericidin domain-containing protein n=1 Tax=Rhizobium sp. BK313 TaxID=2587081 RepID=UPI00105C5AEF|nr:putative small secreted protein [Rhizobium sp. BK313]
MTLSLTSNILAATLLLLALSSCGNTIRGMGRDTANAVNATQDAGRSVDRAAKN